jgi:hypothetical protein
VSARARWFVLTTSYAILGSILFWSRLAVLDAGYCCDEIRTVVNDVRGGPHAVLVGPYIPNNHELFSLLGWATSSVVGESAVALRLWSVIPFLLGVAVVTFWLHRRMGALSAVLFLFLATMSPLLVDITRMARGYGLAFLAMSVLMVAALEAERSGRTAALWAVVAAGLVGSLTLPHFAIAFVATAASLLTRPDLRARVALGTALSSVAIIAWYGPHLDDIAASTSGNYGMQIDTAWIVTAPIDQTLVPALTQIDDSLLRPSLASAAWAIALALLIGSSPLLRRRGTAAILCSGVAATVIAFWVTGTYVAPRFFSFLLVPLFILVATGSASVLARLTTRPAVLRTVVIVATLGIVTFASVPLLIDVSRLPRDAGSEAATTIARVVPSTTPVFAHLAYPHDLRFHLGRPVIWSWTPAETRRVCRHRRLAVYLDQPYLVPAAAVPCTRRQGVRHYRFEQYARGKRIDVWIIPPPGA